MKLYSFLCNEKLSICVWRQLSGHLCHLSHFSTSANLLAMQLCLRTLSPRCLRDCSAPWSYVAVKVQWERIDCWGPRKGRKSRTLELRASCSIATFTVCAKRLKVSACKVVPGQPGVITAGLPFHQLRGFLGQARSVVSLLLTVWIREFYGEAENRSNQGALPNAIKGKMHCLVRELSTNGEEPKE